MSPTPALVSLSSVNRPPMADSRICTTFPGAPNDSSGPRSDQFYNPRTANGALKYENRVSQREVRNTTPEIR
jgi:hypothetical protein